jgi:hypothetical protein
MQEHNGSFQTIKSPLKSAPAGLHPQCLRMHLQMRFSEMAENCQIAKVN